MPIIKIDALPQQKTKREISLIIQMLANLVAKEMEIPAYAVRCIWQEIDPIFYTQGGHVGKKTQPRTSHGPLISFTLFEGRGSQFMEKLLHLIAKTLAIALEIDPKIICIICYEHKFYHVLDHGQIFKIALPSS